MDISDFLPEGAILNVVLAVLALGLLAIGLNDWRSRRGRQIKTKGVVFDHVRNTGDKGDTFTPKIRFTTGDGRQVEIVDDYGVSKRELALGTPLTVIYPADHPERGRVPRPVKRIAAYVILLSMLAVVVAAKIGVFARFQQ